MVFQLLKKPSYDDLAGAKACRRKNHHMMMAGAKELDYVKIAAGKFSS